jgi:multidrug resistance protein
MDVPVSPLSSDDTASESGESHIEEVRFGVVNSHDLEAAPTRPGLKSEKSTRSLKDPNLVTWDGPDDPDNPKNWAFRKRWAATLIVSSFTFISPVSSSMVAPALGKIGQDLGITQEVELSLTLSIFVLAYAIGPLFLGPLSEIYGRVIILQLSNLFFLAWNIACGFAQTQSQLIAFRFLSGLGGSAPLALGGGVLSDCWHAEERGKAISIYSLAPLLGPAVGPIAGGFIAMKTTWRWCFWSTSIVDAGIQVLGVIYLRETYAPKLLSNRAEKLRKETGNPHYHTEWESPDRTLSKVLRSSLIRPFRLLGTQPIIQVLALYMAYLYGLMYLVLSTFPSVWEDVYHESVGIGGLNYISLGVGFFLGTQICAPINDGIYRKLKRRNNNEGMPEFRVPLMVPGAILVPIGLFIYGWSARSSVHWIVPNIGAAIFAAGTIMGFQCTQTYIVDAYSRFAASAVGSAVVLRSLAGFGFPLFAPYMYDALGLDWGNSMLAFIGIGLGIPAPLLLWKYGPTLRAKSTYAAG